MNKKLIYLPDAADPANYKKLPHQLAAFKWLDAELTDDQREMFARLYRTDPVTPPAAKDGFIELRFTPTGSFTGAGLRRFNLHLTNNGTPVDGIVAYSGQPGDVQRNLVHPTKDSSGSMRPIPEGVYSIGKIETAPTSWGDGLGKYWIAIEVLPAFRANNRGDFGFHIDANAVYKPGSAGCIVTPVEDNFMRLLGWLRADSPPVHLVVDYDLGFLKSRGYTGKA
jgi:hypothetical protein